MEADSVINAQMVFTILRLDVYRACAMFKELKEEQHVITQQVSENTLNLVLK